MDNEKCINRLLELIKVYKQELKDLDIYKSRRNLIILENGAKYELEISQNIALQQFLKSKLYDCQTMLKEFYNYEEPRNE